MKYILLLQSILIFNIVFGQCSFGGAQINAGTLTPTAGYQTVSGVSNGQYFTINAVCGSVYNFTFCSNGGNASWDTQITVLASDGTTSLAYNDDNCGLQSDVSYTATSSGTIYVLITEYYCNFDGTFTGATLAYNATPGSFDASFTMTPVTCGTANATITGNTGGTFSFNPAPGDGAVINPTTGQITNGTAGTTYTVQYTVGCSTSSTQNVTLPVGGNASFTIAPSCGGATSTITGDSGGVFSFNPAPGDGAQINSTTGLVSNATAGNTYTVQYSICGVSTTQNVTVLNDNCFNLNGNAQYITVAGEQCIQLTAEVNNQTGCSWNTNTVDFAQGFTLTLDYYFGNNIGGADGNTFTFQPSSSSACGQDGGQLGAGGLSNALSIEFDTYDNDYPTHLYDTGCDHIAVEIDGNMLGPGAPYAGPVCAKSGGGNIDDGGTYEVIIEWDPATYTLRVYFDGALRLTTTGDFVNTVFGGQSEVYWGATSATGGLNNQQYFCPSSVTVLPAELGEFQALCDGNEEEISWTTHSEYRTDHFEVEYSIDGYTYYTLDVVEAAHYSQNDRHYSIEVPEGLEAALFRLKTVDEDGATDFSPVIARKQCLSDGLIQNQYTLNGISTFEFSTACQAKLIDQMGRVVQETASFETTLQLTENNASGFYILQVLSIDGKTESRRIYH